LAAKFPSGGLPAVRYRRCIDNEVSFIDKISLKSCGLRQLAVVLGPQSFFFFAMGLFKDHGREHAMLHVPFEQANEHCRLARDSFSIESPPPVRVFVQHAALS
jgi:hypothetical protein